MPEPQQAPPLTTPVLLIAFNRIAPTRQVFNAIRAARPTKLYLACDGPRNPEEALRCEEVRALAREVDWPCELHTRFNERNLGLRKGVSSAIAWFFEHEPEGIVLEDDTLPVPTFFRFCQELLERYRHDERVWVIMGNNLMDDWPGGTDGSYYYSAHGYGAPWGWASWRRTWSHYDVDMGQWPALKQSPLLKDFFLDRREEEDVHSMFDYVHCGRMNSWSYQLDITRVMNHGLNILPAVNLIRNIGFGADGTHTVDLSDPRNKDTARDIVFPLQHPRFMMLDARRDRAYFRRFIGSTPSYRFKRSLKALLGGPDGALLKSLSSIKAKLGGR
ncbi:MAG: nucleotide-diphospho-sugar transferase [Flavobacteriales bacterium]|nr:nucleotide-diphospho-sugar transferase [Flavobacteriales bacterium]